MPLDYHWLNCFHLFTISLKNLGTFGSATSSSRQSSGMPSSPQQESPTTTIFTSIVGHEVPKKSNGKAHPVPPGSLAVDRRQASEHADLNDSDYDDDLVYSPTKEKHGQLVRRETNEQQYRLRGEGLSPDFDPENPVGAVCRQVDHLTPRRAL